MTNICQATLTACFVLATNSASAIAPVSVTVNSLPHEFFGNYSIDYLIGSYYGAVDWPSFSTSLSTESSLTFRLNAPDGFQFQYSPSPNSIGINLSVGTTTWSAPGSSSAGVRSFLPSTITLDDFQGRPYDASTALFKVGQDRKSLSVEGYISWYGQAPISFSGITMTVDLSQLASESIAFQTYTPNAFGARFQDVFSPASNVDPGASLKLVAVVPEASTWLMLSFGIGVLAIASRRNARSERVSSLLRSEA